MNICPQCGHRSETKIDLVRRKYSGQRVTTARLRRDLGWSTDTVSWVMRELVRAGCAVKESVRGTWTIHLTGLS